MKKNYIVISILGSLWGLFETQVGTLLHAADLPFVGLVMMACGMFFQTTARCFTRMRGSALLMAFVVAFLKLLFVGGIAAATVVAIFIQSLILEIVYLKSSPSRLRLAVAGGCAVSYSLFHPFLSMPVFMGLTFLDAYEWITGGGSVLLGLPKESGLVIIFILFLVHFVIGFMTSIFSTGFALKLNSMRFLSSSAIEKQ
ncbi:hypothetical protein JXA70_17940 [candidate division KSB1 bacterium]|nr:hypothetical protein [candidate division KSB1 bacterium]